MYNEKATHARGNLTRIDNALANMLERLRDVRAHLENVCAQVEAAKAELGKPFPKEDELREKSARLAALNAELDIDDRTPLERTAERVSAKAERPSVLDGLKAPSRGGAPERRPKCEREVR